MEFIEIVIKAQKGDLRAASLLAKELGPIVENMVKKYIKRSDDWKDTSQTVFTYFFKQLPTLEFPGKGELLSYLHTLVKNQCLKHLHSETTYQEKLEKYYTLHADDDVHVEIEMEIECLLLYEDIEKLVERLPDFLRMIFNRIVFEKCDYKDLAIELNIPEVTLRSHMCRARKILRKLMHENN